MNTSAVPSPPEEMPANKERKRFAVVGAGGRSWMYLSALSSTHRADCQLVAMCDTNRTRMNFYNREIERKFGEEAVPTYLAADFDRMVAETRPDVVIVCTIDRTHHEYIARAMELCCDVITEKPMTIDMPKCRAILDAVEHTGRKLTVTFNYRYSPIRSKVKELIAEGAIGEVKSVHFEWLLDTNHGADYFRRWHREKGNSGGLLVHKSTHHFDLVNWWLDSSPDTVFAQGSLAFYGKQNAQHRGVKTFYERGTDSPEAAGDPFALNLRNSENLKNLYLDAEHEDGYRRDQSVFGEGITIEDTMNVLVKYKSGAQMSYSLYAYAPWEGYRVAFNGTKGRIELNHQEASYINAGTGVLNEGVSSSEQLLLLPLFGKPEVIDLPQGIGGHGGGDPIMLDEIFGTARASDPLKRAADHLDGVRSILVGIAANEALRTGQVVHVDDLLSFEDLKDREIEASDDENAVTSRVDIERFAMAEAPAVGSL